MNGCAAPLVGDREGGAAVPVLLGDERLDLALAVDDEAERDALDAPGAEAEGELAPDQGRHVVSDDAVEHAAARCASYRSLSSSRGLATPYSTPFFVISWNSTRCVVRLARLQLLGDVPGDGLALAVGVGREQDMRRRSSPPLQLGQDLLLARDDLVRLLKPLFDVDPELLRQILDVPLGGDDVEPRPQVLLDRLGLRRRLDDDERLDHQQLLFRIVLQSSAIVSLSSAEEARRALYYYVLQSERQERGGGRLGAHPRTCRDRIGMARRGRDRT